MYDFGKMIASHIHDALRQVQELKQKILEKQRFKGYSGRARALSGTAALVAAACLSFTAIPRTVPVHFLAWYAVFMFSVLLNFGAIIYWFLLDPGAGRDLKRLRPVIDVLPPLAVGGILTFTLVLDGRYEYLFGTWMCLYGLANLAGRHTLPKHIAWIGLYYIAAGAVNLTVMRQPFLNPWPMGLVFFLGEWIGGILLHYDEAERFPLPHFLQKEPYHAKTHESV